MMRMAVLLAAESLADVPSTPPDRRHLLTGNRDETFAVDLDHPYRLIFEPDHDPIPRRSDSGILLESVTAIVVIGIEDYH